MAKAKATSATKKKSLSDILAGLEKDYGKGAVIHGNEMEPVDNVISTGSLSFDIATGIGGIPVSKNSNGKIIEIVGWESSGKSTITQTIIGNAQKAGITCLLVDGENSLDPIYTPALGVNMEELYVVQLDEGAGEAAFDKMFRMVESGEIGLVVIDSYNSLQPKKIVDEGLDQQTMGLHARILGRAVMKANAYCKTYGTTFIFIGQLREKIGVMFGPTETTQGGNALRFYAHMRIDISRSTTTDNSIIVKDEKIGNLHKIRIAKNKMAAPFKKAEFYILYGVGIDKYQEILDMANEYGIAKKWGATFTYKGVKYDYEEFSQMVKDNDELFNEMRNSIINEAKVKKINTFEPSVDEKAIAEAIAEEFINEEK